MEKRINKYEELNKILSQKKVIEYVKTHNRKQELDFYNQILGGYEAIFGREDYIFLLHLGVPIGVIENIDSKGKLLIDENDEPIGDIRYFYKPINNLKEYFKYLEINPSPDIIVNPEYMTKKEVRNLLYCLEQSNNNMIFDLDTMDKLQLEIINAVPLKYNDAMEIFNKYFDESIQRKFIYEHNVKRNRFYYLSGLKKLIPKEKIKNIHERR